MSDRNLSVMVTKEHSWSKHLASAVSKANNATEVNIIFLPVFTRYISG